MIYLFLHTQQRRNRFQVSKVYEKKWQRKAIATAAVHYSILRFSHFFLRVKSATDIKRAYYTTQLNFRLENNYAKIFRDINSFEIFFSSTATCLPTFK